MIDFDYWSPTYISFGKGKESHTGELVRRFGGRKVLLHFGGGSAVKSEFIDAPVMNELPLVLECELVSMNEENCNVVGKIVNCGVEESAMTDGKPDADKMKPICFDPCQHVYRLMGEVVGKAFSCGKELM